ncbi:MAG: STAS domain-containing protein [Spirochaetales bacterium]|nr:STAS domain-containing protein [Spirochaetales bacterium]
MIARPDDAAKPTSEDSEFKAKLECSGDSLNVSVSGRLDTITAPDLLERYRETAAKNAFTTISFDMKDMEYISSAGLRVLLLMRKSVADNDHFELCNMSPAVRAIIETAGFDNLIKK